MGQGVGQQPLGFARLQVLGRAKDGCGRARIAGLLLQAGDHALHGFLHLFGIEDRLDIHLVEHVARLGRVEDVAGLVDAELLEDDGELLLQYLTDPMLDRAFEDEVDRTNCVSLADTIHPADPLFEAHRVPGDVVVDHHVAELEVQTFPAGVGGNENTDILGECLLDSLTFFHVHGAVQTDDREPALGQESTQHLLGGNELGEHERLELRIALLGLKAVEPIEQRLGLGIRSDLLAAGRGFQEQLDLSAFVLERLEAGAEQHVDLLLAVQVRPFLFSGERE
ncbi:MAG: hypothetical protein BWX71_02539 [Deltaproteobacteria bacterium ADurb.Bin072]|nr:MAG: hypothetical protein BWX71_02539 [Deltaproteobacteria bacterium ADurb.Bin072]